ncbi:MAG: phosphoribosylanthranilate isomerase [Polyangiaceae bacterium]
MTKVKICGITNLEDARMCIDAGADALGLNFVSASPRCISVADARVIADAVSGSIEVVGVVANMDLDAMRELLGDAHLDTLQLHGDETPSVVSALLPHAYKAIRIANANDVEIAMTFPGDDLLLDAKVPGVLGGSGHAFDWSLIVDIAKKRRITLAGGLTPENVQSAIRAVSPHCVDVASGVEVAGNTRKKDVSRVRAFVTASK